MSKSARSAPKVSPLANAPAADLFRRLAALFYDTFPLFAVFIAAGFLVTLVLGSGDSTFHLLAGKVREPALMMGVVDARDMSLHGFIQADFDTSHPLYILYLIVMLSIYPVLSMVGRGQTLGQRAWKIKTVQTNGQLLSLPQAIWRTVAGLLAVLPFGLGLFWALIDPQRRTWFDMLSQSKVVRLS